MPADLCAGLCEQKVVYAFSAAAAVSASRVSLIQLRGGSVIATLRIGGVSSAAEPSASLAVTELSALHSAGEFVDLGPDLPVVGLTTLETVPLEDEVQWGRSWAEVRAELAPRPEPEPEPEPEVVVAATRPPRSDSPDDALEADGSGLGAIGGVAGAFAALFLLVTWRRRSSGKSGASVHPISAAHKLGGFAEEALSGAAQRAIAEAVFRKVDLDGNGSVDRREIQKLCEAEGLGYHGAIMREMDVDRNGTVSLDEFCNWWCVLTSTAACCPAVGADCVCFSWPILGAHRTAGMKREPTQSSSKGSVPSLTRDRCAQD